MALTRITKGVIKPNENYDTHNINSTGIVTAIGLDVNGNGDISGNLNVGGVLTYEDVTSIDSVGIITAQSDVHVGGGVSAVGVGTFGSLDIGGDIDVDGHTNLDNISVTGVSTFSDGKISFNEHGDISGRYINLNQGNSTKYIDANIANGNQLSIRGYVGSGFHHMADFVRGGLVGLNYSGNRKLETSNTGITVTGTAVATGADINGDLDVDGHTNLDNVSIAGVTTFTGNTKTTGTTTVDDDILPATTAQHDIGSNDIGGVGNGRFRNAYFSSSVWVLDSNGGLILGSGADTAFYHNGSGTVMDHSGTGNLTFRSNNGFGFACSTVGGETALQIIKDGAIKLYQNNSSNANSDLRFETTDTGAKVTGNLEVTGDLDVDGHTNLDNVSITGVTTFSDDVTLTTANGNNIYIDKSENSLKLGDSTYAKFGGAGELMMYHDGTYSVIKDINSSPFNFEATGTITFAKAGLTETYAKMIPDGAVELYHNGIKRLETSSVGVSIPQDLDVDGHTNLDNVSIAGVTTSTGLVNININASQSASNPLLLQNSAAAGNGSNPDVVKLAFGSQGSVKASIRAAVYGEGHMAFHTNNDTEKVRITAGGQVRIANTDLTTSSSADDLIVGTTSGNRGLTIFSGTSNTGNIYFGDTDTSGTGNRMGTISYYHDGNYMRFSTNGNQERFRIDSSGNFLTSGNTQLFGSNTSDGSDNKAIMINGGGAVSDTRGGYLLVHGNEHSSYPGITRLHAGNVGTAYIAFNTAGSERLRIGTAGQLGIGGANYGSSGQVLTSGGSGATVSWSTITGTTINNNADNRIITGSGTANTLEGEANLTFNANTLNINGKNLLSSSSIITYSPDDSVRYQMGVSNTDGVSLLSKNTSGSYNTYQIDANTLKVRTTGTNSPAERLRITSSGSVGINSTSPSRKLVVVDNLGGGIGVVGGNAGIYMGEHHTGGFINNCAIARAAANNYHITGSAVGDLCIAGEESQNILFGTSAHAGAMAERLRIHSNGNITTSSTVGHLLLGTDTARTFNSHNGRLQVTGTTYSHSTISVISNTNANNGAYLFLGKQRSGAIGGSTAVQANDLIGEIRFPAGDGTDMENYAARIIVSADQNASSNNTSGIIDFHTTRRNGSPHLKLRIGQNSNHGTQFSFGTETSDLNNSSTPDRTSLKVGPATHIEGVFGHNGTSGMYYNCYSGGNDNFYRGTRAPSSGDWRPAAYGQKYGGHYFYGDPSNTAYSAQAQVTTMQTNMTISRDGYVRKQYQPAFDAVRTSGTVGDGANLKIVFNSTLTNVGNHYDTSTGYFTAPIAGTYFFSMHGMNNNQLAWYNFRKNDSVISPQHGAYQTNGTDWSSVSMTIVIVLAANDTMSVYTGGDSRIGLYGHGNNHNGFCGYMLG